MKKIFLLPLLIISFSSCGNLSLKNEVQSVLNDGLFRNYSIANAGGYSSDAGILNAKYRVVWASNSYRCSISKISAKNPDLSQFWLEKYVLLTTSLSDGYGAFVDRNGFSKNGRGFYFRSSESDGTTHSWYWYPTTCLLMEYSASYPDGSNVRYGYDWTVE